MWGTNLPICTAEPRLPCTQDIVAEVAVIVAKVADIGALLFSRLKKVAIKGLFGNSDA